MLKALWARLVVASLLPVIVVTMMLYPFFAAYLEERLDGTRGAAEALLEAKYAVLLQDMNESFNQVLATAEFPLLRHYLASRQSALPPPAQDIESRRELEQLEALFNTLLTHFGRYTRLTLLDTHGREQLSSTTAQLQPVPPVVNHAATEAFQEAMQLQPRELYISPPHPGANSNGDGTKTAVIDIVTPVFDDNGVRLGVVFFALDWFRITASLSQAMEANHAQALLVDAQGRWLLPDTEGISFGETLATSWPDTWQAMTSRNRGEAGIGEQLLWFRTHDIRMNHYRSQAGMIMSQPDTQPWRLGIVTPRPSLPGLLLENPAQILAIALVYLLSVAVGIFWVLSHDRQRSLRQRALLFFREARQYAGEVQDLYENAPCGYHSLDSEGRIVKINRTELEWLGYRADEIIDRRLYRDFVTPETREAFDAAFQQVLGKGQEGAAECELLCRDGTVLPVAIQATAQVTEDGFQYARTTVFDLSERKRLEARLERQAMTDPLTGLGNRRYLEGQAALEIARAQRSGAPLSLIAIDLDHFKRINDSYGHDVGDLVLQAFADTARGQLRDGDVLCRMGGEEFAVLLPDTGDDEAMQVAERLRQTVVATPVKVGGDVNEEGQLAYSASLGVTLVNAGETSLKPAIKRADQGLYIAKEAGRNQAHWQPV
ncbi:diguanylate cyclase [Salinicola salarius]|uniref:sensor domain-containing diguanylate cyclase n=1 Tax=Salinicola salarius TaxID=430457 RepID=UPI0023E3AFA3|nr:diguanylate cyclase [Salinicola salarius]MDF3919299.1 diguanylate cyclase [Salinicola salarius]